jgi:hypothetical protein
MHELLQQMLTVDENAEICSGKDLESGFIDWR